MGTEAKAFSGTVDKYAQMLEKKEAKALYAAQGTGTKDGPSQFGKRKDKRTPLDLPLKWSIKGESKGTPSTSTPLLPKVLSVNASQLSTLIQVPKF